ncbi:MAG TPA: DNA repair protein RecO [Gaiellaceae bacterium]|nr:DNA repair protein RecO [Gaiellaceae bacterium]
MAGRTYKTEAVVLRSLRLGEADRILHLYTLDRGRIGAVAKGIRRTKSRYGGRLEPLSHVEVMLHQGSGELQTVTGAHLVRSHAATREGHYRLSVGLVGAEAMLRLFTEQESSPRAFEAITRYLDACDTLEQRSTRAGLDPLALSFQLKLLWLSGYQPHTASCAECGAEPPLAGYLPRAGGAVCRACIEPGAVGVSPRAFGALDALLRLPLAEAHAVPLTEHDARELLAVVAAAYEFHGGFRLRTLSA